MNDHTGSSTMASSSGSTAIPHLENGHNQPEEGLRQRHITSPGRAGAGALTMNEHYGSSNMASSSGTMAILPSENRRARPGASDIAFVGDQWPVDGRYGSLLDDSPAATTYDPLQHQLLSEAVGEWSQPTSFGLPPGMPEWQPLVDDVVSPSALRAPAPLSQSMPQQQQPHGRGDRTSPPERAGPVRKNGYVDYPDLPDKHIFNGDPNNIAYGNLLRLSTRYTNSDIFEQCNKDRQKPVFESQAFINNRITAAMKWAVENWNMSYDDVGAWLNREKVKNALPPRMKNKRKRGQDEQPRMAETTQGDRVYVAPSKRINAADTALASQQQHFSHPAQGPSTPAKQTATSMRYAALPTPAATPNSAMNISEGQKKRKCIDDEHTHSQVTDTDGSAVDTLSKRRNMGEAMSSLGTHTPRYSMLAPPTPTQETATSTDYSASSKPAPTPDPTMKTSKQKKRKRTDDDQAHPLEVDHDNSMLAPPAKRTNIGEAMAPPQAHAFSQLVQAISTPTQKTANPVQYATTPATSPPQADAVLGPNQTRYTPAQQMASPPQYATTPTMPPPQADAFLQLKQALSTPAQQTPNLVPYVVTRSPTATAAGLARTAAIRETMLAPPSTTPGPESDDIFKFRGVSVLDDYRPGGLLAVNLGRIDPPMAPAYSIGSASQPVVIDLTGDD